jgi:arsenic resistance protein ArsH
MAATASGAREAEDPDMIWTYQDPDAFASLSHPGYTMESDPVDQTGGWLAHQKAMQADPDGVPPPDWIADEVADVITKFDYASLPIGRAPKILVLYGSLRESSFSRKLAYENARLLELLGCDVRVYNPRGLPVRDPDLENEVKVQELRALTLWSDGHVWGTFKRVAATSHDRSPFCGGRVH